MINPKLGDTIQYNVGSNVITKVITKEVLEAIEHKDFANLVYNLKVISK